MNLMKVVASCLRVVRFRSYTTRLGRALHTLTEGIMIRTTAMLSLKISSAGTTFNITRNTTASVDTIKLTINLRYWVTYYTASVAAVA